MTLLLTTHHEEHFNQFCQRHGHPDNFMLSVFIEYAQYNLKPSDIFSDAPSLFSKPNDYMLDLFIKYARDNLTYNEVFLR